MRQELVFSADLAVEFGLDSFFKQPALDDSIQSIVANETQENRLLLYKHLLRGKVFVPITTKSQDDPNSLIYTFPNQLVEGVEHEGNLICAFTNANQFNEQVGQHGLSYQKISADFLCFQARNFSDILGITITNNSGESVLITRDEFHLLALISQPQRMDTDTLLKELGNVFFDDVFDSNRDALQHYYNTEIQSFSLVRSGFYCKPTIGQSKPLFCLVVKSSNASDQLTDLVMNIQNADLQSFCDCHIFSLSDIVAQSLEQSKCSLVK